MSISEKVKKGLLTNSHARSMFEESRLLKKKYGDDQVFDLTVSSPTLEPPEAFIRELRKVVLNPFPGMHRYMENAGYTDTRRAVAAELEKETGIKFDWNDVVMTGGAAGALNSVFKTLINGEEEILVFAPFFYEYASYIDNYGGICTVLPTDPDFVPDLAALETAISSRTKAVVINSPNDPAGVVYSDEILKQIAGILEKKSVALKKRIYIVSDDVYHKFYYPEKKLPQIIRYYPHTILVRSFSKDLFVPGERLGYMAVHPDCEDIKNITGGLIYTLRTLGFVNASAIMQNAVRPLLDYPVPLANFQRKRDFLYEGLRQMGYSVTRPEGAFYLFPQTPLKDDRVFADELKKHLVLTVPGSVFKAPGHLRVSYCVDDTILEKSLAGFRRAIEKYDR